MGLPTTCLPQCAVFFPHPSCGHWYFPVLYKNSLYSNAFTTSLFTFWYSSLNSSSLALWGSSWLSSCTFFCAFLVPVYFSVLAPPASTQGSAVSTTWELLRHAKSGAPPQTCWVTTYVLRASPADSYAHTSLSCVATGLIRGLEFGLLYWILSSSRWEPHISFLYPLTKWHCLLSTCSIWRWEGENGNRWFSGHPSSRGKTRTPWHLCIRSFLPPMLCHLKHLSSLF